MFYLSFVIKYNTCSIHWMKAHTLYSVDAEYGIGGKNKVTRVTWFSFGTLQFAFIKFRFCLQKFR